MSYLGYFWGFRPNGLSVVPPRVLAHEHYNGSLGEVDQQQIRTSHQMGAATHTEHGVGVRHLQRRHVRDHIFFCRSRSGDRRPRPDPQHPDQTNPSHEGENPRVHGGSDVDPRMVDGRAPWKQSRWANTATWPCRRTPGIAEVRRWCRYHMFAVAQMGEVGRAQATSVSPGAQAQLILLRDDHHDWRQTPAAATRGSTMRVFCCICGKTRPSTPQRSPRVREDLSRTQGNVLLTCY
jgi:hypothetical protein